MLFNATARYKDRVHPVVQKGPSDIYWPISGCSADLLERAHMIFSFDHLQPLVKNPWPDGI